jgi:hypothetical protein
MNNNRNNKVRKVVIGTACVIGGAIATVVAYRLGVKSGNKIKVVEPENVPVYILGDAVEFIAERCDVGEDAVFKVLSIEEDYMRSVGII